MLDFETLAELKGKFIRVLVDIRRANELPIQYCFKVKCKYVWQEANFETNDINKSCDPVFNYTGAHMLRITEEFVQEIMYNTLTIKVYGMIKAKPSLKKSKSDNLTTLNDQSVIYDDMNTISFDEDDEEPKHNFKTTGNHEHDKIL